MSAEKRACETVFFARIYLKQQTIDCNVSSFLFFFLVIAMPE